MSNVSWVRALAIASAVFIGSCGEPPSWSLLVEAKIAEQYPDYKVQATDGGALLVQRPGVAAIPVDVNAIAQFCQRGPKDCNYAIDKMLVELRR